MKAKIGKKILFFLTAALAAVWMLGATSILAAAKTIDLSPNTWYTDRTADARHVVYYKIQVGATGYLTFSGYGYSHASDNKYKLDIRLCDKDKQAVMTEKIRLNNSNLFCNYAAVKKGTYYIRVNDYLYKLKYNFRAVSEKSGSSRQNARKVLRNETMQGRTVLGEAGTKIDWYQFYLPTAKKISFTFGAKANNWIQFRLVPADKGMEVTDNSIYQKNTAQTYTTQSKMPKGRYYIQVKRYQNNPNISGFYSLRWK